MRIRKTESERMRGAQARIAELELRVDELEKLRSASLIMASKTISELERRMEDQRKDHVATLIKAIALAATQDELLQKMRGEVARTTAKVDEAMLETSFRMEGAEDIDRPMSHSDTQADREERAALIDRGRAAAKPEQTTHRITAEDALRIVRRLTPSDR